jgi:hypothetical protein
LENILKIFLLCKEFILRSSGMNLSPEFMPQHNKPRVRDGETLAVYLDTAEYLEIRAEAESYGMRRSDFARRLIRIARKLVKQNPELLLSRD